MQLIPSRALVKQSLSAHSWIGLLAGALMYLVCLSGTIAVFYPELERWEQPAVAESLDFSPAQMERAYQQALARDSQLDGRPDTQSTHHIYMSFPTDDSPRAKVSTDTEGWFINTDGSLGEAIRHEWTGLLTDLHLYLHLPSSFGMIVVSMLGALLCALIISGFVAHPRIFKDAFSLRLKGSRHLEQADIHNRLSVWGAPFHLMIGITGAFFGLAGIMSMVFASALFDGNSDAVTASIYGPEPELNQSVSAVEVEKTLHNFASVAPEVDAFYLTIEDVNAPEQYSIVGGLHRGQLIYAEQYRFDSAGNYLDKVGFSDGEPGRQAIFSVYRIHFGHFGGFAVKIIYAILGLALTVVAVSGINVWFARRKTRDYLNNIWMGIVWGTPVALAVSAVAQVVFGIPATALLWATIVLSMALAQTTNDDYRCKFYLLASCSTLLVLLVAGYTIKFGAAAFTTVPLSINATLLLTAVLFAWIAVRAKRRQEQLPASNTTYAGEAAKR